MNARRMIQLQDALVRLRQELRNAQNHAERADTLRRMRLAHDEWERIVEKGRP